MERRETEISAALMPGDPRDILSVISGMFMGFGGLDNQAPEDVLARMSAYVDACSEQPLWAVQRACRAFGGGDKGPVNFAPSSAAVGDAAKTEARPFREELSKLRAILTAKIDAPEDPERRKQVADRTAALAAQMRADNFTNRAAPTSKGLDALLAESRPDMTPEERAAHIEGIQRGSEQKR